MFVWVEFLIVSDYDCMSNNPYLCRVINLLTKTNKYYD